MLNILAVTVHNNYAKTSRLYLQSPATLEKENPQIFEQFILVILGNPTVRCTEKICSMIWTDLLVEQMLTKSLKGRDGVIGKGISKNVVNVWKKNNP